MIGSALEEQAANDQTAEASRDERWRFGRLRAFARVAGILAATAFLYSLFLLGSLLLLPWPRRRRAWRDRFRTRWARAVGRLLGLRWRVEGRPPEPPFLMVTNHVSYTDIFPLMAVTGAQFVAKSEVGSWPLIGRLARSGGTVLIDRGTKRDLLRVGSEIERRLADGGGVIVFPEGTTGRGDALLPFKSSLLEVAVRGGAPVWYGTIGYRYPDGSPPGDAVVWWGDAELMPHLSQLLRVPRLEAVLTFGPKPLVAADRKLLAERLHAAMSEIFLRSAEP